MITGMLATTLPAKMRPQAISRWVIWVATATWITWSSFCPTAMRGQ